MRIQISLAKNIYNQDAVSKYLDSIKIGQQNVDKWIATTLRTYLINEWESEPVEKLPKTAPDWAKKSFKNGELENLNLKGAKFNRFIMDIEHAIGWLQTFEPTKALNVSVPDAIKQGNLLIEKNNKKASDGDGKIEVLYKFKDGYTIVNCLDTQALKREGKLMGHCVGDDKQNYIRDVADKSMQIWSLRDSNNGPHCTISYNVEDREVTQIKGKQNEGIVAKYIPYVKTWFESKEGKKLVSNFDEDDLKNIGVIAVKGVWLDAFNLPDGFTYNGSLDLTDMRIEKLPDNMTVTGKLSLGNDDLDDLPKNLSVGSLLLDSSRIKAIREDTIIRENLTLRGGRSVSIPANYELDCLTVEKARFSGAENLKIRGVLKIKNTQMIRLPKGLHVMEDAFLPPTMKTIPKDAIFEGDIFTDGELVIPKESTFKGKIRSASKIKATRVNGRLVRAR